MRGAAADAGVAVVTGDTKLVQRGSADKLFINTSGVGVIESPVNLSATRAQVGDKVILSGTLGDHGTAIMIARGELELETDVESDTALLNSLVQEMLDAAAIVGALDQLHSMRDPTRGGLATTLNEIALSSGVFIEIDEHLIPLREEVKGACEILGLDPLYVANEGKLIAIVAAEIADRLVSRTKLSRYGLDACIIGAVKSEPQGIVAMRTGFGGTRIVDMLVGNSYPGFVRPLCTALVIDIRWLKSEVPMKSNKQSRKRGVTTVAEPGLRIANAAPARAFAL
jgi:hydrogenase expression/formation protein HypE